MTESFSFDLVKAMKMLFSLIAAVVIAVILFLLYLTSPYFSAELSKTLSHESGRKVALAKSITVHLWSSEPSFILRDVNVGNAPWGSKPSMFTARRVIFSVSLLDLLKGRLAFPEVILDHPVLLLEKNGKGEANWDFSQNAQSAVLKQPVPESRFHMPLIGHLQITDGKLTYRDPPRHVLTQVDVSTVTGEGKKETIHLSGQGTYQDKPFSIDLTGASVLQLRQSSKPYPFSLKTTIGKTSAEAKGTVEDPFNLKAFDVTLKLKGENAADLFPILGIALPPTPPYQVTGRLTHQQAGDGWQFANFSGHMGSSDLKGNVSWYPAQKPPYLKGKFTSDNLDMKDLAGFIGAQRKPADPERIIPDTSLDISRLMAMNADVDFKGEHVRTPQLLDDFYMNAHLKDGVLKLTPVSFGIAKGAIKADVTIEGRKNPPAVAMEVHAQNISLNRLFAPLAKEYGKANVSAGLLGGYATLHGTGKSLQEMLATSDGEMVISMEGGDLSRLLLAVVGLDIFHAAGLIITDSDEPVPLHCVIAHFTVHSGVMRTHEFLIDTSVTSIRVSGGVNLHDETIHLQVHTFPKEPSLLSAHSPIYIDGTLKHPEVGVNKAALLARGGIAAALAALAPPAAWLAFIEPGLEKGGSCATLIRRYKPGK